MLYIGQVIAYTGILYLVYILLLRNRPIHAFNRIYLIGAALLPVFIPFIKLSSLVGYWKDNKVMNFRLPEVTVDNGMAPQVNSVIDWAAIIYASVTVVLLLVMLVKYIRLQRMVKNSEQQLGKHYTLLLNTGYGPGSWGRYIVLPDAEVNDTIIQHEAAHLRLRHSMDILGINLLQCLLWPDIFLYFIKKELRQVHEFQADAAVGADIQSYGELLLSNTFNTCTLPFTHSFNIHPLKRRIMMLKKRKSPLSLALGVIAIFVTGLLLFNMVALQSCKAKKWEVANVTEVDKGAEFDGNLIDFMSANTKYPKEAIDKGIEGRVVVRFLVDDDGTVKNAEVLTENCTYADGTTTKTKAQDGIFGKAALDVVHKMPKWIPAEKNGKKVAVYYQQPFTFRLPGDSTVGYLYEKKNGRGIDVMPVYKSDVGNEPESQYYTIASKVMNRYKKDDKEVKSENSSWSMFVGND